MGCCVSHENRGNPTQKKQSLLPSDQHFPFISKSPPRPEEESVKEVLSETPNSLLRLDLDLKPEFKIPLNVAPETEYQQDPTILEKIPLTPKKLRTRSPDPTPPAPEEISDVSEMCSESISTSTLRGEREEDDELQQWSSSRDSQRRGAHRSQGQNGNFVRNNRANRSPLKRVEPGQRRNNPSPVQRREPGENSGRRSGSPATRSGNVGRSPSGRRTGPSPGRVRMVHGPNEGGVKRTASASAEEERESEWQGPNESLENPLVSLECFIFL